MFVSFFPFSIFLLYLHLILYISFSSLYLINSGENEQSGIFVMQKRPCDYLPPSLKVIKMLGSVTSERLGADADGGRKLMILF
jgi:hypothetical protein